MAKKDAIIERSTKIFYKFGLNKISMEELADQIGISKKTIYNNFGSKENLLEVIIFTSMEQVLENITDIFKDNDKSIIDKIYLATNRIYTQYNNFEIPTKSDPNAARIIDSPKCIFLSDQILGVIQEFTQEAQTNGIIKKSINIQMIPYLFLNNIRALTTWQPPEELPFTKLEFMKHSFNVILDGILTPKAMKEYLKS